MHDWFDELSEVGPKCGYHPELRNSILVVHQCNESNAIALFADLGVKVMIGHDFLGNFIGSQAGTEMYVEEKIQMWLHCPKKLTKAAGS